MPNFVKKIAQKVVKGASAGIALPSEVMHIDF